MVNHRLNYSLINKLKNLSMAIATIAAGIGNYPSMAQIAPDTSLGAESSVVTPGVEIKGEAADRIDGGAIREGNLFHSFSEFNVGAAQRVYFANPNNIEQIFTRVTGNNASNINGILGVDGAADLLLLNPNGIIFGENSSLDVQGSFFGTSADSVLFEDETEFSAVQPSSLLTVSVPVGLQMGNPGSIEVRSPLEVADGQNFILLGGEINLTSSSTNANENGLLNIAGGITAPGGKIELGGLSTTGIVGVEDNNTLRFPEGSPRTDVALNNFLLNTLGSGGGSIRLYSQNLQLTDSTIQAGIDSRVPLTQAQAGDIAIDTLNRTVIESSSDGTSQITNITGNFSELTGTVNAEVVNTGGDAGNIFINTGSFSAEGFYIIGSSTQGEGNAGNVTINAKESVSLTQPELSRLSTIFSTGGDSASGNGANLVIEAKSLSLSNVALRTDSRGEGNAGNIQLNIIDSLDLSNNSELVTNSLGQGNAGNLNIVTGTINVRDSIISAVSALPNSPGRSGNLDITASESINLEGKFTSSSGDILTSSIASLTGSNGDAGRININTGNLTLVEGSRIDANTISAGNGGDIDINAESINVEGSSDTGILSSITASSAGSGRGGSINITSSNLTIRDGVGAIVTQAEETGDAGNININTERLTVENNVITTGSIGTGQAGDLDINASTSITLNGTATEEIPAGLSSTSIDRGNAGNLSVNTGQLTILNGAQVQSATGGIGDGGNVSIEAEQIKLIGSDNNLASAISAFTTDSGTGGTVNITTNNLALADGAAISVRSVGDGDAGSIFAQINDSLELNNGFISSRSDRSSGGEVEISAGDIRLRGDSNIQTSVENGAGGGGNITLTADSIVAFDDSDIFSFSADGRGGNITLNTDTFFGANYTSAALDANPQLLDNNSRVDINATGSVSGFVELPEIKFLPNSLVELSEDRIDAEEVVANSCVVRSERAGGTFIVTGSEGLPSRPGDAAVVDYATGAVRSTSDETKPTANNWQPGEPIVEPDKAYQLANGKLVLSRQCS